jgi:DNA-directed RNA polymerase specialized sigma24 family protein
MPMPQLTGAAVADDDPASLWLAQLKALGLGEEKNLWKEYWRRVEGVARKVLAASPKGGADEEDVAQSVFRTFFKRARKGLFPRLNDSDELWDLLVTITVRKASKRKRKSVRQPAAVEDVELLKAQLAEDPTPAAVMAMQDEVQRVMSLLDPIAQRVVALVLEGRTTEEVAASCGKSRATIERKRKLIRETWMRELES